MRRVSKLNKDYMYFYTKVSSANVTPAGRMVYRALLRYANRKTWSCFPSVKTIVNDTGLSERTLRKQIKILVEEKTTEIHLICIFLIDLYLGIAVII